MGPTTGGCMEEIPEPSRSKRKWALSKKTRGQYAEERKLALLKELAPAKEHSPGCGQCDACLITVDHLDGRTWALNKLSRWGRVARYWKEHNEGVRLRALCGSCNSREGGGRRRGWHP